MEHQIDLPQRWEAEFGAPGEERDDSGPANASIDASPPNIPSVDATTLRWRTEGNQNAHGIDEVIFFKSHIDCRYVWPFERCRSSEMVKPLVEEVYASMHDEKHLNEVREGKYDIQTEDGATILPTVWSFIVTPFTTIRILFWAVERQPSRLSPAPRPSLPLRRDSNELVSGLRSYRRNIGPDKFIEEVTIDADGFEPPTNHDDEGAQGEGDESGEDPETSSSNDSNDELPEDAQEMDPIREMISPTDAEGNRLSFSIDTSGVRPHQQALGEVGSKDGAVSAARERRGKPKPETEVLRITKALSVAADGKAMIHLHNLPGPDNSQIYDSATISWYHLKGDRLDFAHFKDTCLGISGLSARMQMLARELLTKIEKHKVKAYLDGLFIEPGTVLRVDERCQPDPQAVIFSCVPYFDLQPLSKKLFKGPEDRLFPPRTLMQSLYPYESVRDRDSEQAYKKFGNGRSDKLVYVPSVWMMNIGGVVVVTCGHKRLAEELVNSIEVVEEDLKQLQTMEITKNTLTNVRLTDWDSRVHLYQLNTCRSYFQMEQKLRDLRSLSPGETEEKPLQMVWATSAGEQLVTPSDWPAIVRRTDLIFIDITSLDSKRAQKLHDEAAVDPMAPLPSRLLSDSVPPFFHWPTAESAEISGGETTPHGSVPSELGHALQCLEFAEKSMMNETLDKDDTVNEIDRSFSSPAFYQALPETTHARISTDFQSLRSNTPRLSKHSQHEQVVDDQCLNMVLRSVKFCKVVQLTMSLFVRDADQSAMLRKLWGAMANVHRIVAGVQTRGAVDTSGDARTDGEPDDAGWYIRDGNARTVPQPEGDEKFKRSVKRCRRCKSFRPFESSEAAVEHLRRHLKPRFTPASTAVDSSPNEPEKMLSNGAKVNLDDWVIQDQQLRREEMNASMLNILKQAFEDSLGLLMQAKDLAEGVRDEDGRLMGLYTFPRKLVEAFRQLVVFYLAVERALHHAERRSQKDSVLQNESDDAFDLSEYERGLQVPMVLKQFAKGAERSLVMVRTDLCDMAMPDALPDIMQDLSLGPHYVCGWLMRRLLVKPLEKRLTIGEMYREYLSTIPFQVNHRPGKRLIRSINLLQEEIQALVQVNTWQAKLIQNYMRVLNDVTYEKDVPSRRAMFPYERMLLRSCLENLALQREDYEELIRRCNPLSDRTKQSVEINEEDHGKAIMVFTIVTIIFLPLSFVTSFFGMNTTDIRDMGTSQSLFWAIAVPLTVVTMGSALFISYNGDELRNTIASLFTDKEDSSASARGISVAQRRHVRPLQSDSSSAIDYTSLADDAEYASPQLGYGMDEWVQADYRDRWNMAEMKTDYAAAEPRANLQTSLRHKKVIDIPTSRLPPPPPPPRIRRDITYASQAKRVRRPLDLWDYEDEWYDPALRREPRVTRHNTHRYDSDDEWYTTRHVQPAVAVYNTTRRDDADDGGVQEYTWHKKHKRRHAGGPGGTRRNYRSERVDLDDRRRRAR